MIIIYY